jgi:hypothetical protein
MSDTTPFLNSSDYLNSVSSIGKTMKEKFQNQINYNTISIESQQAALQDLHDAISTYNQQFVELESKNIDKKLTLQDWSLLVFFLGYAVFSLIIFIHILFVKVKELIW